MKVPHELRNSKINLFLQQIISSYSLDELINGFDQLDEIDKNKFVSLCIESLKEIDIFLSKKASECFAQYLRTYDSIDNYDFIEAMQQSTYEIFGVHFNKLIEEKLSEKKEDFMYECGMMKFTNSETGETIWA